MNHVLLVDLSSVFYPIWHQSGDQPDTNYASTATVTKVRALASNQPSAAICCDKGRSFRYDLAKTYKANRPAKDAAAIFQYERAASVLAGDGFPVWAVDGYEADDLIATATMLAQADAASVTIASADKDLLQLVQPGVTVHSLTKGTTMDEAAVVAAFGVTPAQMVDYLTLVGDASDNIRGVAGIGPKTAAKILTAFGSLDALIARIGEGADALGLTPAIYKALLESSDVIAEARALVTLKRDAPIPFAAVWAPRVPVDTDTGELMEIEDDIADAMPTLEPDEPAKTAEVVSAPPATALARLTPPSHDWALQPRDMTEAVKLANALFKSRLFSAYGTPEAVLSTILAGAEFGIKALSALRSFHILNGRPTMSAGLMRAIVLRSGQATYFRCTERTPTRATFETQRGDEPPQTLTYTIEEARAAYDKKWEGSAYERNPADMLVARASSKLARLVYEDVLLGLYATEEFNGAEEEMR